MDFDETYTLKHIVIVLVYAVGGYWIMTYVKKYGNTGVYMIKLHISMFYLEVAYGYHL